MYDNVHTVRQRTHKAGRVHTKQAGYTPSMTASTREFFVPRKLRNTECPRKAHDQGQPTKGTPRRARAIAARGLYHAHVLHDTGLLYGSICCAIAFRTIQGNISTYTHQPFKAPDRRIEPAAPTILYSASGCISFESCYRYTGQLQYVTICAN